MRNGRMYYYSFQKNFFPNSDMLLKWNCEEWISYRSARYGKEELFQYWSYVYVSCHGTGVIPIKLKTPALARIPRRLNRPCR
jgi:hypothetical protein